MYKESRPHGSQTTPCQSLIFLTESALHAHALWKRRYFLLRLIARYSAAGRDWLIAMYSAAKLCMNAAERAKIFQREKRQQLPPPHPPPHAPPRETAPGERTGVPGRGGGRTVGTGVRRCPHRAHPRLRWGYGLRFRGPGLRCMG